MNDDTVCTCNPGGSYNFDKIEMHNLITDRHKVIEYQTASLPSSDGIVLKLYEDGSAQIECLGSVANRGTLDKEIRIEFYISPDKVKQYADKLIKLGFLNFNDNYSGNALDGWQYTILLNYQGISKEVECQLDEPESPDFKEVIEELDKLVEIELNKIQEVKEEN